MRKSSNIYFPLREIIKRNNKKKNKYTFLTDLLNITIPYITVIGTILLICLFI